MLLNLLMEEYKHAIIVRSVVRTFTAQNMPEEEFSLTHIFPYKDRIIDYVLIQENTGKISPYSSTFYAVFSWCFLNYGLLNNSLWFFCFFFIKSENKLLEQKLIILFRMLYLFIVRRKILVTMIYCY